MHLLYTYLLRYKTAHLRDTRFQPLSFVVGELVEQALQARVDRLATLLGKHLQHRLTDVTQ